MIKITCYGCTTADNGILISAKTWFDDDNNDDSDDDNDVYNHDAMKRAKLQRHCVHRRHHCRHRHRTKLIRHAVLVPGASWFTPLHDVDRCSPMYRMYRMISWRLSLLCQCVFPIYRKIARERVDSAMKVLMEPVIKLKQKQNNNQQIQYIIKVLLAVHGNTLFILILVQRLLHRLYHRSFSVYQLITVEVVLLLEKGLQFNLMI